MLIKYKYNFLTVAEKKIADFILSNRENVLKMTIAELAKSASVANSAIVRCCNSLGFKSYSELKISLAADISQNKQLNFVPYIHPDENASEIMDKIFKIFFASSAVIFAFFFVVRAIFIGYQYPQKSIGVVSPRLVIIESAKLAVAVPTVAVIQAFKKIIALLHIRIDLGAIVSELF